MSRMNGKKTHTHCLECCQYLKKNLNASQNLNNKLQRRLSGCAASPFIKVITNDSERVLVVFIGGSHEDDIHDSAK